MRSQVWVTLVSGILAALCAGTMYAFGVYNKQLREDQGWTGSELNVVGSAGAWGQYLAIPPGLLFDRRGPRATSLYAMCLAFTGYFMMFLQVKLRFTTSYVSMALWLGMAGHGSASLYIVALMTNTSNFPPARRGLLIGVLASAFGLSAAGFTALYRAAFAASENMQGFLLTLAITLGVVGLGAAVLVRKVDTAPSLTGGVEEDKGALELARLRDQAASSGSNLLDDTSDDDEGQARSDEDGSNDQQALLPALGTPQSDKPVWPAPSLQVQSVQVQELEQVGQEDSTHISICNINGQSADMDLPWNRLFCSANWVLLWSVFVLATGSGLMFIENVSLMADAESYSESDSLLMISLLSYSNCAGRLLAGWLSDRFLARFSRGFFLMLWAGTLALTHGLMIVYQQRLLYVAAVLNGVGYGGLFASGPVLVTERFGVKHFGFNFGVMTMGVAVGSTIFNEVAGAMYDEFSARGQERCSGEACFRGTFVITSASCAVAVGLAFLLARRTRHPGQLL